MTASGGTVLRQRAISAVLIVAVALVPAVLGHPVLTVALALLGALGILEFCRAVQVQDVHPETAIAIIVGVALITGVGFQIPAQGIAAIATVGVLTVLAIGIIPGRIEGTTRDAAFSMVPVAYVALPIAHIPLIRNLDSGDVAGWLDALSALTLTDQPASGFGWLVLIVAATWLNDTAAFLGGSTYGRRKLAPVLSPKKTIEGGLTGLVAGAVTGALVATLLGLPIPAYVGAVLGLLLSVVGQIGDLAESLIKRDLGIKDMGDVIPGHGGMLDRIDALLFTLPVGYYLILLTQEVTWP